MSDQDWYILKYVFREFPPPPFLVNGGIGFVEQISKLPNETYTKLTYKDVVDMMNEVFNKPLVDTTGYRVELTVKDRVVTKVEVKPPSIDIPPILNT